VRFRFVFSCLKALKDLRDPKNCVLVYLRARFPLVHVFQSWKLIEDQNLLGLEGVCGLIDVVDAEGCCSCCWFGYSVVACDEGDAFDALEMN